MDRSHIWTHTHRDLKLLNLWLTVCFFFPLPSLRNHCSQIWATTHWQTSRSRRRLDAASSVRCTGRGTCSTTRRSPWRKFRWAGNNEEELFFSYPLIALCCVVACCTTPYLHTEQKVINQHSDECKYTDIDWKCIKVIIIRAGKKKDFGDFFKINGSCNVTLELKQRWQVTATLTNSHMLFIQHFHTLTGHCVAQLLMVLNLTHFCCQNWQNSSQHEFRFPPILTFGLVSVTARGR